MLVSLFRLLAFLPLPVLHALGWLLGWLVYLCAGGYRRRMRANMAKAGVSHALRQAVGEAGKGVFELPFVWCASPARVRRACRVENWELAQAHLDAGHGILFLTPHLGCFELTAQAIAEHVRLTVMYRPPRKAALKPLVEGARARANLELAPATMAGVRILAKALKNGQPIGLLPDQTPRLGEGVWADFFGQPAYSMTLPAKLQKMSKAVILLTWAERLPYGRGFVIRFSPFETGLTGDAKAQARQINAAMEELILRCPAQYVWSYNRYKIPPGVDAPEAS
ncbi:lysophospholipid acyltransferase family protein [Massilia sp. W12]|uniref:lysophospholipid acyltransferase family protein n=1 Tax=Massilia sp. W12 TaxID=3126507 RepID=UPI0030D19880